MRKNFILATAGHVDHGKTSLIKALTGKDCDTHPEEKKRGITIHLGFSHIQLSEDIYAGIVDVPGHKDFIDNMISGINGIDLVLFIIAADEGFMPQSFEHLQILNMLEVKKGIIIITKCDLVDKDTYFLVKNEIKEKVKNTFLEFAPIIGTSVAEKSGMEANLRVSNINSIKTTILKLLKTKNNKYFLEKALLNKKDKKVSPSPYNKSQKAKFNVRENPKFFDLNSLSYKSKFRLYPDRFFHIKGFGSVLTGTVLSGQIDKTNILYTVPMNKEFKIRKMESYNKETQIISQGQRASLNITNFDKEDFEKGMMLCSEPYSLTVLIDVEMRLFGENNSSESKKNIQQLDQWSTVEFYTATIQTQAKIHLIDKEKIYSGEKCFAQFHLNKPISVCFGDKFIIRNSSGTTTLGGGKILDAFPLHHRRRTEKVKDLLKMRASGFMIDLICSEIEKSIKPISLEQISKKLFINISKCGSLPEKYIHNKNWFWLRKQQDRLENKIIKFLQIAHKQNPLDSSGKKIEEFQSIVQDFPENARLVALENVLKILIEKEEIVKRKQTYALASHQIKLDKADHDMIYWVDQYILSQKMHIPLWSELKEKGARREINEKRLKQILFYLVGKKRIIHHEGEYLHSLIVNPIRKKLLEYLSTNKEGISVAEFRDLIAGNRKISVLLLNIFDNEGIIKRIEDKRFITEKGRQYQE
ncbi:MAG: SelB C-terminal domain-containing protein [Candidatus Cloacimonetes bacterium]|nr:SelB C-terminal domain-containing protein [Candidatus Cloacimonadota bacterium]